MPERHSIGEEHNFPIGSFGVITACQCFWYFDHERVKPKLTDLLKADGKMLILYMAWLPFEDDIAGKSEELVKWLHYAALVVLRKKKN